MRHFSLCYTPCPPRLPTTSAHHACPASCAAMAEAAAGGEGLTLQALELQSRSAVQLLGQACLLACSMCSQIMHEQTLS